MLKMQSLPPGRRGSVTVPGRRHSGGVLVIPFFEHDSVDDAGVSRAQQVGQTFGVLNDLARSQQPVSLALSTPGDALKPLVDRTQHVLFRTSRHRQEENVRLGQLFRLPQPFGRVFAILEGVATSMKYGPPLLQRV